MSKLLDQVSILRNKSPIIPQTKNPTNVGVALKSVSLIRVYLNSYD
jgi:hypothetical protein